MASFDITVDGACKGKPEDVAKMKQRLKTILDNGEKINDPQWLRELFGSELNEIDYDGPFDVEDKNQRRNVFGELFYRWGEVDIDNLQFRGNSPHSDNQAGYVNNFLLALERVFPRVGFDFIVW